MKKGKKVVTSVTIFEFSDYWIKSCKKSCYTIK